MPLPDFQSLFLPLLRFLADGQQHTLAEARETIARDLGLSSDELAQTLKSGQAVFVNRMAWAASFLKRAHAISSPARGTYRIEDHGRQLLNQNPHKLTIASLHHEGVSPAVPPAGKLTPEEQLEQIVQTLQSELAEELLEKMLQITPAAFEALVVKLLTAIGYGATVSGASQVTGKPGDGGIDGIIKQDRLGLDVVYIQAKRWQGSVGSPEVMKFCGSLTAHHAAKGVILTTSHFTPDAVSYVQKLPQKIVLINGREMANLMIEHHVGVSSRQKYIIQKLDSDYFEAL